jgi:hypothetical protein
MPLNVSHLLDNAVTSRKIWLPLQTTLTELGHTDARHCAVSRKVAASILGDVIEIFRNPGRTVALGSTQALEMSTMGKGGRCVDLTNLPPSYADDLEVWDSQPSGTLWACISPVKGLLYVFSIKFFSRQEITEFTQA